MFVRPCWQPSSESEAIDLIEQNPWALLVSSENDEPVATNLPLLWDRKRDGQKILIGHIARANLHSKLLKKSATALAIFQGPYSYVTASWYPERDMPPTYYYTTVHCYGSIVVQDEVQLEEAVDNLTNVMERPIANGWKTSEIPHTEIIRRLPAIVGFEFRVQRMEAKFKLGQDEPIRDALAVADQLELRADNSDLLLADLIRKQNAGREH